MFALLYALPSITYGANILIIRVQESKEKNALFETYDSDDDIFPDKPNKSTETVPQHQNTVKSDDDDDCLIAMPGNLESKSTSDTGFTAWGPSKPGTIRFLNFNAVNYIILYIYIYNIYYIMCMY